MLRKAGVLLNLQPSTFPRTPQTPHHQLLHTKHSQAMPCHSQIRTNQTPNQNLTYTRHLLELLCIALDNHFRSSLRRIGVRDDRTRKRSWLIQVIVGIRGNLVAVNELVEDAGMAYNDSTTRLNIGDWCG